MNEIGMFLVSETQACGLRLFFQGRALAGSASDPIAISCAIWMDRDSEVPQREFLSKILEY